MARMIIATPEPGDAAVLTSPSTIAATLPLANLQTQQPGEAVRFTDLGDAHIVADLGAATALDLVAPLAHTGTPAATWRIRAAATEANLTAAPGYDSGTVSMWPPSGRPTPWARPHSMLWLSTPESWRWWRIDIFDAANPAGYLDVGRLYLSSAWQPADNVSLGWSVGVVEDGTEKKTAGGQLWPQLKGRRRVFDFRLELQSEADLLGASLEIDLARGRHGDVLFCLDPEEDTYLNHKTCYGLLRGFQPVSNEFYKRYSRRFKIEELVP